MTLSDPWLDSEEEHPLTQETARFLARANCVAGIHEYGHGLYGGDYRTALASSVAQRSRRAGSGALDDKARQLLRVAWQTELAAHFGLTFSDSLLLRVGAQTLPVHAYYAIFNGFRALARVSGGSIPTHSSLQEDFGKSRAAHLPRPWCVRLQGDPEVVATCKLVPEVVLAYSFNPIERKHKPPSYLWAALRMSRRWKVRVARGKFLQNERRPNGQRYKILPAGARERIARELRPTTLLDFVYELRRQAQYETADEYASDAEDRDVERFYAGMLFLMDSALLLAEASIAARIGIDTLRAASTQWQARAYRRMGGAADTPLHQRVEALEQAFRS